MSEYLEVHPVAKNHLCHAHGPKPGSRATRRNPEITTGSVPQNHHPNIHAQWMAISNLTKKTHNVSDINCGPCCVIISCSGDVITVLCRKTCLHRCQLCTRESQRIKAILRRWLHRLWDMKPQFFNLGKCIRIPNIFKTCPKIKLWDMSDISSHNSPSIQRQDRLMNCLQLLWVDVPQLNQRSFYWSTFFQKRASGKETCSWKSSPSLAENSKRVDLICYTCLYNIP